MTVTIIATPGATNANSYITLADANTYFADRLNTDTWDAASNDERSQALIMATYRLEQERYQGDPWTSAQALKWPRMGLYDSDGRDLAYTTVPRVMQHAVCELALALLAGEVSLADTGLEGFASVTLGQMSVTPRQSNVAGALPFNVIRLLQDVIEGDAGISLPLERG